MRWSLQETILLVACQRFCGMSAQKLQVLVLLSMIAAVGRLQSLPSLQLLNEICSKSQTHGVQLYRSTQSTLIMQDFSHQLQATSTRLWRETWHEHPPPHHFAGCVSLKPASLLSLWMMIEVLIQIFPQSLQ